MIVLPILQVPKTVSHALREAVLTGCAASSQVWSDGAAYTGPRWVGLVARLLEVYSLYKAADGLRMLFFMALHPCKKGLRNQNHL